MSDLAVAKTILAQLGGNMFVAMTGARDLLGDEHMLQFKLPPGAKGDCNKVRITLDPTDTYTVQFLRVTRRGLDVKELAVVSMVYDVNLRDVFTEHTGLYTSL